VKKTDILEKHAYWDYFSCPERFKVVENAAIGTMRSRKNQIRNGDRSSTRLQEAQTITSNIPHLSAKACSA
jgi:hypothetical protein